MKGKWIRAAVILLFTAVFTLLATAILYICFPHLLYRLTYDVYESDLYESRSREVYAGESFTETFSPELPFVMAIGLNVERRNRTDEIIGRLYDDSGKLIAEDSFNLIDVDYNFSFMKRLDTDKTYKLEILISENNKNPINLTFGPEDIGPSEHISFEDSGEMSEEILYTQYIYGTYSKKLVALWMLVFAVTGLILAESVVGWSCRTK